MFDANARGLPVGCNFFVYCHSVKENSKFSEAGMSAGEYYYARKAYLGLGEEEQIILFIRKGACFFDSDHCDLGSFLSYEGLLDGSDFICEKSKRACMQVKEELNLK